MYLKLRAYIFLLCVSPALLCAQQFGGAYTESYLLRDIGARAIGMGGAYSAVANEPSAVMYNPAGLAFTSPDPQVMAMVTPMNFGRNHSVLSYGQTVSADVGVGFAIANYSAGSFVARNAMGEPIGDYSNNQLMLQSGIAGRRDNVAAGISFKFLNNTLSGGSGIRSEGWAMDIGMKVNMEDIVTIGVTANNLFGTMTWNDAASTAEDIPYSLRFGVASEIGFNSSSRKVRRSVIGQVVEDVRDATRYLLISTEVVFNEFDTSPRWLLGAELVPHEVIGIRLGFPLYGRDISGNHFLPFNAFGTGISLRALDTDLPFQLQFDYAMSADELRTSGLNHHFAIIAEF